MYIHENQEESIHSYRVVGRHCDHRHLSGDSIPRICPGKSCREEDDVSKQLQADRDCDGDV